MIEKYTSILVVVEVFRTDFVIDLALLKHGGLA